jgi:uncharacterized protein involved in outer membrane biogenesis
MAETQAPRRRRRIFPALLGILALCIVALVLLWNWDWFIPIVESQASAALGRKVTLSHLHVHLGRNTTVAADDVVIANPADFPQDKPLASIGKLTIVASVLDYIKHRTIVLPSISLDRPDIEATALPNGENNWTIKLAGGSSTKSSGTPPQIGDLRITGGIAHVVDPKAKADFNATIATSEAEGNKPSEILVSAKGTYASQPIVARFIGGALLSLRDTQHPYPIDFRVANGPTKVSLVGTVQNPLDFAGAKMRLLFSGTDMSLLFPLTGIPFPQTPPFSLTGDLDYAKPKIRFHHFAGRVGSSDLNGDIDEDPGIGGKPDVTMDLYSKNVDLADLGGFIGAPAGKTSTPGETGTQKKELAQASTKKTIFPDTKINLPKLRAANIHLKYRGEHIENKFTPFDKLVVALDVVDGRITLHPLNFVVGKGEIASNIDLDPGHADIIKAKADVNFRNIDLSRVLQATHTFKGQGILGGEAKIDTYGNSMASMMGQGNGELKLILLSGGNVSALLVDIAGLEFGNALLSALGVPNRATLDCFVADFPLHDGIVDTKALLLDTSEARMVGKGTIDLRNQTLDYSMTTRSKHFSVGSLPGPIDITGPLGSPSIRPGAEVAARAGAAVGLGVLLTPLGALLPTIQFGVGKDNACTKAIEDEREPIRTPLPPRRRVHK